MTIMMRFTLFALLLLSSNICFADLMKKQIKDVVLQQLSIKEIDSLDIKYLSTKPIFKCDFPVLTLLNKSKYWGNMTLSAKCNKTTQYIQIYVSVIGKYFVANQPISAGTQITEDHIKMRSGQLDQLPASVIIDKAEIINKIAIRNINNEEPLKSAMLQKNWRIKAGQIVKVMINGDGYLIATNGKALSNGALDDLINIKLQSGNIVEGLVTEQGITILNK